MEDNLEKPWIKVVGMGQQNWAFIEKTFEDKYTLNIVSDKSEVFEIIDCESFLQAKQFLMQLGFRNPSNIPDFLTPPNRPFVEKKHPNNFTYISLLD